MCRMLAKVAIQPFNPAYELLEAPHSLRIQSQCGRQPDAPDTCGPHASGCGMAWPANTGLEIEKRGPDDRWDDSFVALVKTLRTPAILAHNRLASPGLKVDVRTSHPFAENFRGTPAAFCHNGGVFNLMDEAKTKETTDSQLFFSALLAKLSSLDHAELASALKQFADTWRYTSLSGMLLTPTTLHVWRCYDQKNRRRADFEKYYTLWVKRTDGICIASEPVDQLSGWELMPNRALLSISYAGHDLPERTTQF